MAIIHTHYVKYHVSIVRQPYLTAVIWQRKEIRHVCLDTSASRDEMQSQ